MRSAARAWGAAVAMVTMLAFAAGAPVAHAGEWIQVSCVNPNGTAASSQGWAPFTTQAGYGSGASTTCAPGTPMIANLSDDVPEPVFSSLGVVYTPPPGSTLIGGEVGVLLAGAGGGTDATGDALIYEPAEAPGDIRLQCAQSGGSCSASGVSYSGEFMLPADLGGDLYVVASCGGSGGYSCDSGGSAGAWSLAEVSSADLLLQNDATPTATAPTGNALGRDVHGTAHLNVSAADRDGPGVYEITATIDGKTVYRAIPDRNDGQCAAVGTDKTTGALEFDYQQPCPPTVTKTIAIPTATLPDGDHALRVSVTDAAENSTTVLDRTIRTENPRETPRPSHGLGARFLISWRWDDRVTELLGASAEDVSPTDEVAFSCTGSHCPALHRAQAHAADLGRLLRSLAGTRFSAGDRLLIVVSARHRTAERIALTIRNGRRPTARLLHPRSH